MINHWWVTRPKRKLNSVPEDLATFASVTLNKVWEGDRSLHLSFEDALEAEGLKRVGERRDHGGGGGRTYVAWFKSLGLIFQHTASKRTYMTLAGEAILSGGNSHDILTNQVIKYQFPSSFSTSRGSEVNPRFKIHPFVFLLRLLRDNRIGQLTQSEIAKVVIVKAENETQRCYEDVVQAIINYRNDGDNSLEPDFDSKYAPSRGGRVDDPYGHLEDTANTFLNWLEYTRYIVRDNGVAYIPSDKQSTVDTILANGVPFIERPDDNEFFQRKYGLAPGQRRDNRDFSRATTVTSTMVETARIRNAFISESLRRPIGSINAELIDTIVAQTSCDPHLVEDVLHRLCPHGTSGALDAFLVNYREYAFQGTENATRFETTTKEIMENIFGYRAKHVGPQGLTPDVLVISDSEGTLGIFDNKAYASYSITNDHHNRMVTNYIGNISNYNDGTNYPLAFFSYIAGGFKNTIDSQLRSVSQESHVSGSAITVDNFIQLIKKQATQANSHAQLNQLFSIGREIHLTDF